MQVLAVSALSTEAQEKVAAFNASQERQPVTHVITRENPNPDREKPKPDQYVSATVSGGKAGELTTINVETVKNGTPADRFPQVSIEGYAHYGEATIDKLTVSSSMTYGIRVILWPLLDLFKVLAKNAGATRLFAVDNNPEIKIPFEKLLDHGFHRTVPLGDDGRRNYIIDLKA